MSGPSPLVRSSNGLPVKDGSYAALGFRQVVKVGFTAPGVINLKDITDGIPSYANKALVSCEGGTARWTDDGIVAPTASVGMPMFDSCLEWLMSDDLSLVQFYLPAGVTVSVSFYA